MPIKPAISDLVWHLYKRLRDANIPVIIAQYENNFIKAIRIGRATFMTKFANESGPDRRHWFGFTVEDVEHPRAFKEAILVIGKNRIDRCYSIPYSQLTKYLRKGEPVWIPRQNYFSYKATIFPKHGYVLKVEKGDGSSFQTENYRIDNIEDYFRKFISATGSEQ